MKSEISQAIVGVLIVAVFSIGLPVPAQAAMADADAVRVEGVDLLSFGVLYLMMLLVVGLVAQVSRAGREQVHQR